jgi:hypothetical protein
MFRYLYQYSCSALYVTAVILYNPYLHKALKMLFTILENTAVMDHRVDYATPLYPQKLALTSPTSGSRSVGIVRSRTQATEFSFRQNVDRKVGFIVLCHIVSSNRVRL